jgi:hypothetical protein
MREVIVGIQGPSPAGKSTLSDRIAAELDGSVIHELAESADRTPQTSVAVPADERALLVNRRAFLDFERRRWAYAVSPSATRPAVFDTEWIGQLLWGLYDLDVTHPSWDRKSLATSILAMYRERVAARALGCCDAIVLLDPPADVVRRQRDGDQTRTRRNFERNLRIATLMRPMWDELLSVLGARLVITGNGVAFHFGEVEPVPIASDVSTALQVLDTIGARF